MYSLATLAALIPLVAAHGSIKSPPARQAGSAYSAACGEQPFNQQSADKNGNVQGILQVVGDDFNAASCKLWQCKGFQFDDNKDNVQQFSPGQTIDFDVEIAAPHTGYANVSVVKTGTDTIIGQPLIEFDNYASNAGVDANNTAFSVTLPNDFGGDCTTEGDCVLQWYWDAPDINQTYESCVDFVVSGSGGGNSPAPSSSAPTSTTPAATSVSQPTQTAVEEDPVEDEEPADDDCEDEEPVDDDEDAEPVDDEDGEDCDEEPVDEEPADDEDDCGEGDLADDEPTDGADDDEQNNGSDEYPEQTPTSAPGPIIVPITDDTPAPTQTGGSGSGSGNGNGNDNENGSKPTSVSTVTVTAAPSTVTVTAQPTVCL